MGTKFTEVYDRFFGKITDDMYMELTPSDTLKDLRSLILDAIPGFEFPRQVLTYKLDSEILDYNDYPEWGKINSDETQDNNYYQ